MENRHERPVGDLRHSRRHREPSPVDLSTIDRLPPHSPEAEQGVLGCIMLDPQQTLAECVAKLKPGQNYFYDLRHQTIYDEIVAMTDDRRGVDVITLQQSLKDKQRLEEVGGIAYLSSLLDALVTVASLGYYLDILVEKYTLRKAIAFCTQFVGRAYEYQGQMDELIDALEIEVLALRDSKETQDKPIREVVHEAINDIERLHKNQGSITGISTGLPDLDKLTDGLHDGEVTIIAAFPSCGKTALAMNIVERVILDDRLPVGVFSLEMSAVSLVTRMIASRARINLRNIRDGFLAERDFPKITNAAGAIAASRLFLHSVSDLPVGQLRAIARRMKQQHGIRLLVVDYLQLLDGSGSRTSNREQEVAKISKACKGMAEELGLPVLALSQLNDDGKLRESRAIGQDADNVWILNHDDRDAEECDAKRVALKIVKQRNGPRNVSAHLLFLSSITRFESAAKVSDDDVPTDR